MNSSLLDLHGKFVSIRVAGEGEYGSMYRGTIRDIGAEFILLNQRENGPVLLGRRFITSIREAK